MQTAQATRAGEPSALVDGEQASIEYRQVYGEGTVVTTATLEDGVVLLEQHTPSSGRHALIPLTSVAAIERLEAFLVQAKACVKAHEEAYMARRALLAQRTQPVQEPPHS